MWLPLRPDIVCRSAGTPATAALPQLCREGEPGNTATDLGQLWGQLLARKRTTAPIAATLAEIRLLGRLSATHVATFLAARTSAIPPQRLFLATPQDRLHEEDELQTHCAANTFEE